MLSMSLHKVVFITTMSMLLFCGCSSLNVRKSNFQVTYIKSKGRLSTEPHFMIKLKGDSVHYNGIANMLVLGERNFTISKAELEKIKEAFEQSDFSDFDKLYQGNIRDLPMTSMTYNNYEVRFQDKQAPEKLKRLEHLLEDLITTHIEE